MEERNINEELERAVSGGKSLEDVKALLDAGANVHHKEQQWKNTLLHSANSVEITKELLQRGIHVDTTNMYSETPLYWAVGHRKKLEIIRELLKHGAYINATNRKGDTALHVALKNVFYNRIYNLEVIKVLLEYGPDIYKKNRPWGNKWGYDSTCLELSLQHLECGKLLIKFTLIRNYINVNLNPYKNWENYSELSSYLNDCASEIDKMKKDYVKRGLALYEYVTYMYNRTRHSRHLPTNNKLSLKLISMDFSENYPVYNDIILQNIKPFLERGALLDKLTNIQIYIKKDMPSENIERKKIILDYDSVYNITDYLSDSDLSNFIAAFDDFNQCNNQSLSSLNAIFEGNEAKRPRLK